MSLDLTISPETMALVAALRAVPLGEEISHAALSAHIGRDVAREARARLDSALRILSRDEGAAFMAVRGVGLRRLRPEEAPDIGARSRRKVRRMARHAAGSMTRLAATSNGLPPEAQRRLSAELSAAGLLAAITEDKPTAAMGTEDAPRPPVYAAEAFLAAIGAKREAAE